MSPPFSPPVFLVGGGGGGPVIRPLSGERGGTAGGKMFLELRPPMRGPVGRWAAGPRGHVPPQNHDIRKGGGASSSDALSLNRHRKNKPRGGRGGTGIFRAVGLPGRGQNDSGTSGRGFGPPPHTVRELGARVAGLQPGIRYSRPAREGAKGLLCPGPRGPGPTLGAGKELADSVRGFFLGGRTGGRWDTEGNPRGEGGDGGKNGASWGARGEVRGKPGRGGGGALEKRREGILRDPPGGGQFFGGGIHRRPTQDLWQVLSGSSFRSPSDSPPTWGTGGWLEAKFRRRGGGGRGGGTPIWVAVVFGKKQGGAPFPQGSCRAVFCASKLFFLPRNPGLLTPPKGGRAGREQKGHKGDPGGSLARGPRRRITPAVASGRGGRVGTGGGGAAGIGGLKGAIRGGRWLLLGFGPAGRGGRGGRGGEGWGGGGGGGGTRGGQEGTVGGACAGGPGPSGVDTAPGLGWGPRGHALLGTALPGGGAVFLGRGKLFRARDAAGAGDGKTKGGNHGDGRGAAEGGEKMGAGRVI